MLKSCSRKSLENNLVNDAGICRGSSSIAMIFRYMYNETKNDSFLEISNYWITVTLDMSCFDDGLAGYKTWAGNFENDFSLLTGISGVGLMLLSTISNDPLYFKWSKIFLFSN